VYSAPCECVYSAPCECEYSAPCELCADEPAQWVECSSTVDPAAASRACHHTVHAWSAVLRLVGDTSFVPPDVQLGASVCGSAVGPGAECLLCRGYNRSHAE